MRITISAVVLIAAAVSAQSGTGEGTIGATDRRFSTARAVIERLVKEGDLPGVAVAVAKDGKILWQEAFGWANREQQVRATPATAFSLASISKPMTATGLMRLVEQKKVDLDRPVNDYLGRGKLTAPGGGDASGATVRRVLAHSAGLPLHHQFFYAGLPYSEPPVDDTIARYGVLVNPPGSVYLYSNLGYGILDQIIERVSGRKYADFMRDEVFAPLGMRQSSVHIAGRKPQEIAERYDAAGKPIPYYDFDHDGGSAVYASAHDLVKFGMFHLGSKLAEQKAVIGDETRALMTTVQTPPSATSRYGLGWFIAEEDGIRRIWHTGSMPGVTTILNLYPDANVVTVLLLNTSNGGARLQITQALSDAILTPRPPSGVPRPQSPERGPFKPTAEQLGEWTGTLKTWERDVPLAMRVEEDGDIKVRLGSGLWTLLNQVWWTEERLAGRFAGTIPTADAGRHPHTIQLELRARDGKLAGQATAIASEEPAYFALSSYAELTKRPAKASQ